jgi:hypothetical protein
MNTKDIVLCRDCLCYTVVARVQTVPDWGLRSESGQWRLEIDRSMAPDELSIAIMSVTQMR